MSRVLTFGSCLGAVALLLGFAVAYIPASLRTISSNRWALIRSPTRSGPTRLSRSSTTAAKLAVAEDRRRRLCTGAGEPARLRERHERELRGLRQVPAHNGRPEIAWRRGTPPPLPRLETIVHPTRSREYESMYLKENLALAGLDRDPWNSALRDALGRALRRAELRRAVRDLDRVLLGGRLRSWRGERGVP